MNIDITKTYKTRDGRAVTGLYRLENPENGYTVAGIVHEKDGDSCEETWTDAGVFLITEPGDGYDLIPVEAPTRPGLITPDPLAFEYGAFVAAVRINFAAGTFATATPEEFDAWLQSLTPSLAR